MEYLDVELRITNDSEATYLASIIRSPAGEASVVIPKIAQQSDFVADFGRLAKVTRSEDDSRGLGWGETESVSAEIQSAETPEDTDAVRAFGERLFKSVFVDELKSRYRTSLAQARDEGKGIRLRLRLNAPELASLPWEFLYDDVEQEYISLTRETPIVRYVEMGRGTQSITLQPPLKVLGMVAAPSDLAQLDVQREREQMQDAISHPVEQGLIELTWLEGQTWRDLQEALRSSEWHVFHFIGHGGFDEKNQEGFIALCDDRGKLHRLTATQLGRLLSGHRSMRLAVLNCCEGAKASESNLFSSTGAVLTRRDIPAVVSMQYEITDAAAIEFSRMLYYSIANGDPVDGALQEARLAISMSTRDSIEWATPVLHMRTPDGCLFNIDVKSAIFREDAGDRSESDHQVIATRSADAESRQVESVPAELPSANQQTRDAELTILLNRMRQFWVHGVLKNTGQDSRLIDLELEVMQGGMTSSSFQPDESSGADFKLMDFFVNQGGSILLLGDPGAGKSTVMLTLARDLIKRAERNPSVAVPVIVSLSSWHGEPFMDWVVEQTRVQYLIPRDQVESWLKNHQLLLMLDGLDEVQEKLRAGCVAAINDFAPEAGLSGMVVCCRTREYLNLPTRLALTAAVKLKGLTRETILKHVASWGDSFSGLYKLIENDSAMQLLASSPLMLNLMAEVYEGETDLEEDETTSAALKRHHLMDAYVTRMFARLLEGESQ